MKAFNKNTVLAIAGNKIDLNKFDVEKDEVLKFSEEQGAKHFYTSAKTGEGLDEIFLYISKEIANNYKQNNVLCNKINRKITVGKSGGSSIDKNKGKCCK